MLRRDTRSRSRSRPGAHAPGLVVYARPVACNDAVEVVELTGALSLVPVLELEPASFARRPHDPPRSPSTAAAEDAYWRASLADSGLVGLDPIAVGSWLVPVSRLRDPARLSTILAQHLSRYDDDPPLARPALLSLAPALAGGFALVAAGRALEPLLPRCCGDLSTIDAWLAASQHPGPRPEMMWIGHPWADVRRVADRVVLRPVTEGGRPQPGVPEYALDTTALDLAVGDAVSALETFAADLLPVLRAWLGPEHADVDVARFARVMAGLAAPVDP